MRRAWIEINDPNQLKIDPNVALREESVDRNLDKASDLTVSQVALREESVDRNQSDQILPADHCRRSP